MATMTARLTEVPDSPVAGRSASLRTRPTRRSGCCGSGSSSPRSGPGAPPRPVLATAGLPRCRHRRVRRVGVKRVARQARFAKVRRGISSRPGGRWPARLEHRRITDDVHVGDSMAPQGLVQGRRRAVQRGVGFAPQFAMRPEAFRRHHQCPGLVDIHGDDMQGRHRLQRQHSPPVTDHVQNQLVDPVGGEGRSEDRFPAGRHIRVDAMDGRLVRTGVALISSAARRYGTK